MKNDVAVGGLYKSTNYSQFKFLKPNRDIKPNDLTELMAKNKNWLRNFPIMVNSEFFIIDGKKKFLVAKELGIPIYY